MERISVLDHGYVAKVEVWGSDRAIVESARMSTQKGFLGWGPDEDGKPGDEKLLGYLWRKAHSTPFEFAGLIVEVQAPIFVFREWHRHRTQSFTEASARYSPLPSVDYVPTVERLMLGGGHLTKQAGAIAGARELTRDAAEAFRQMLQESYSESENCYQSALAAGVPKELARVMLPVGRYSTMRATANLWNWLHFLNLRLAENAQWEIRQYAQAVSDILTDAFPRTMGLFQESRAK